MGHGYLPRGSIRQYLTERFPDAKRETIESCTQAAAEVLTAAGVAATEAGRLVVRPRDVCLESLAFVLHSEFPEPGMYDVAKVERGETFRAMLWPVERILPALYELRNRGILSKISEIDSVRQFTTRCSLEQVVEKLTREGGAT